MTVRPVENLESDSDFIDFSREAELGILQEVMQDIEDDFMRNGGRIGSPKSMFELVYLYGKGEIESLENDWLFVHAGNNVTDQLAEALEEIECKSWAKVVKGEFDAVDDAMENEDRFCRLFEFVRAHRGEILSRPIPRLDVVAKIPASVHRGHRDA